MSRRYLILIIAAGLIFIGILALLTYKGSSSTTVAGTTQKTGLSSLFPFLSSSGSPVATSPTDTTGTAAPNGNPPPAVTIASNLKQISQNVVAGLIALPKSNAPVSVNHSANDSVATSVTENLPMVRYAEKGTGYIYDISAKGTDEKKVSSTVLSRAAIAQFGLNGNTVAVRYVKPDNVTVGTFLGTVTPPKDPAAGIAGTLTGDFLPDGIIDLAISPDGKTLDYIVPVSGGSIGMNVKTDGSGRKQIFQSGFSEWLLDWKANGLYATTKAAAGINGQLYKISTTGSFQKVIGNVPGLTTVASPDGKKVLYGIGNGTGDTLHIYTVKDNSDSNTGLGGLPEKCVWTADSSTVYCGVPQYMASDAYPESWYQGLEHFNDAVWKIDASTGLTIKLTTGAEGLIDMTNLTLAQDNSFLYFVNKNDGSLWSLDLTAKAQ